MNFNILKYRTIFNSDKNGIFVDKNYCKLLIINHLPPPRKLLKISALRLLNLLGFQNLIGLAVLKIYPVFSFSKVNIFVFLCNHFKLKIK